MKPKTTPWYSYSTPPNKNKPGRYECTCGDNHLWDGNQWWIWGTTFYGIFETTIKWRGLREQAK